MWFSRLLWLNQQLKTNFWIVKWDPMFLGGGSNVDANIAGNFEGFSINSALFGLCLGW